MSSADAPSFRAVRRHAGWLPSVAILAAATMWGTIGTSYELILQRVDTDPITLVTIRALVATLVVWIWVGWRDRAALGLGRRDVARLLVFGLVTVTAFYIALIYTFEWTSVAVGTVLLYLAPALVTLSAVAYLGERLTRRKVAALALALVGCLLVVGAPNPRSLQGEPRGILLGLVSALAYGSYSLFGKGMLRRYSAGTVLAYHLLFGTAGLMVVKLATSPASWPDPTGALLIGGYNGIVTTLAPITLFTIGLRGLPSSEASILATMEPVVAIVLAAAVLGESLAPLQLAGAAMVVGCVVLLAVGSGRRVG